MDRTTARLRSVLCRAEDLDGRALAAVGLPVRHYALLALLEDGPVARQHELGAMIGLDRSTTATLVRRLADRGLVRRTPMPGNNRVLVLELTPEGDALRAAGARLLGESERTLLTPLTPAERDQLRHVLDRLLEVAS
jgi:DNA-binding MarR family transcriptional regulator